MKIGIYSIKDNVGGFLQPTYDLTEQSAYRNFSYAVNQPGLMNFKPEDYSLWFVGVFDSDTGEVEKVVPKLIIHATEVVK